MRKVWADMSMFRKVEQLKRWFKELEKRVEALEEKAK